MLNKLKQLREANEEGFTLIELLVVIVIIGILAAIALPIFLNQQREASFAAVKSDVKNISTIALTQKTKTGKYPANCAEWTSLVPMNWNSESTSLVRVRTSPDGNSLWIEAQPNTISGSDPDAFRAQYTAVYNSNRGIGVTTRADYMTRYGIPAGVSVAGAEGFTATGFQLNGTVECKVY